MCHRQDRTPEAGERRRRRRSSISERAPSRRTPAPCRCPGGSRDALTRSRHRSTALCGANAQGSYERNRGLPRGGTTESNPASRPFAHADRRHSPSRTDVLAEGAPQGRTVNLCHGTQVVTLVAVNCRRIREDHCQAGRSGISTSSQQLRSAATDCGRGVPRRAEPRGSSLGADSSPLSGHPPPRACTTWTFRPRRAGCRHGPR
jgi:hypothetical protein